MTVAASTDRAVQLLALYEAVARPRLNWTFVPATCIEQSRVVVEVMKRFGHKASGLGTKLLVTAAAKDFQFMTGLDPIEYERAKRECKGFVHHKKEGESPFPRHVVAFIDRQIMVDSTLSQASQPDRGLVIPRQLIVIPLPKPVPPGEWPSIKAQFELDNGDKFETHWIGMPDRDWAAAPGWEPSHLWWLIDDIEQEMRRLL